MSLVRASLLVGAGAVASRVLGFARDILFAQVLGAGPVADAFLAAFRLPNLVRRVVGEGGLNPALVPVLGRMEPEAAAFLAGDVVALVALALLGLTGLVELGAGLVALALAPGLGAGEGASGLVALYTRLAFPAVIGVTLASIGAALLNLRRRYLAATLAPLVVNGGLIAVLLLLGADPLLSPARKAILLAAASSLAGFAQLALIIVALRRGEEGLVRFRRPVRSPALTGLLLAGLPALVASGAVQLFFLAGTQIASFLPSGISWLYYAERVVQLPLGLMAALGASVLLPELAARHRAGDRGAVVAAQDRAVELSLLLALPAAAALLILAEPMAVVLFRRGAFGTADAAGTALVLRGLSLGLPFATLGKVLSQTLFARGALHATLLAALVGIAVTAGAGGALAGGLGMGGIALGISLGCLAHAVLLAGMLRRAGLWSFGFGGRLLRIGLATALMGGGLLAGLRLLPVPGTLALAVLCGGGLALYALSAWIFGAVTREDLTRALKKR